MLLARPARSGDGRTLAPELRPADLREIRAATAEEPSAALERCIACSAPCYGFEDEAGHLVLLFGVVPDPAEEGVGTIWLMSSGALARHSLHFLRISRPWVEKLQGRYRVLWNYVDARNEVHVRWLGWCGFTLLRVVENYGVEQRPFYEFTRSRGGEEAPRP